MTVGVLERGIVSDQISLGRLGGVASVMLQSAGIEQPETFGEIIVTAIQETTLTVTADTVANLALQAEIETDGLFGIMEINAKTLGLGIFDCPSVGAPELLFNPAVEVKDEQELRKAQAGILNIIYYYRRDKV